MRKEGIEMAKKPTDFKKKSKKSTLQKSGERGARWSVCALQTGHSKVVRDRYEIIPVCIQGIPVVSGGFRLCSAFKS